MPGVVTTNDDRLEIHKSPRVRLAVLRALVVVGTSCIVIVAGIAASWVHYHGVRQEIYPGAGYLRGVLFTLAVTLVAFALTSLLTRRALLATTNSTLIDNASVIMINCFSVSLATAIISGAGVVALPLIRNASVPENCSEPRRIGDPIFTMLHAIVSLRACEDTKRCKGGSDWNATVTTETSPSACVGYCFRLGHVCLPHCGIWLSRCIAFVE